MSFVHKITSVAIALAMLASLTACGGNSDTPVTTTTTTTATADTTTTITETTAPVEEETVDIEALLEGYTVYEAVTTSYDDVVNSAAADNIGNHFAIRFTDVPNCAIVFKSNMIGDKGAYEIKPITAYAFGQTLDLTFDGHTLYGYDNGFLFATTSDMICVGMYPSCYLVSRNDVVLLDGSDDVIYYIEKTLDEFSYSKWSKAYQVGQQAFGELAKAYVSDNDFVCEFGRIVSTVDGISLVTEEKYNAGEWYRSDKFFEHYKKYRDLPGCETIGGLVTVYGEYTSSGAFKEYDKFEDWVIQKKG